MLFTEDVSMLISREIIALRFDESIFTSKNLLSYLRVPIITRNFQKQHFFFFWKLFWKLCRIVCSQIYNDKNISEES